MKRILLLVLSLLFCVCLFSGCEASDKEKTTSPATVITTVKPVTVIPDDIIFKNATDTFISFQEYPDGLYFDYPKKNLMTDAGSQVFRAPVIVRVLGYDFSELRGDGVYVSYYYVCIAEDYKYDDEDKTKIYRMTVYGSPEYPLYGRPFLQTGKEYLRFKTDSGYENQEIMSMTIYMPVEEIDGVKYVYGYGMNMGVFNCSEEITDEKENQIYKPDIHPAVIEYLESINQICPTFDYKCKLEAFITEVWGEVMPSEED